MKKQIRKIAILSTLALSLSACNDFLDREPIVQVNPDEYFTSENSAEAAVTGMYRSMQNSFSFGQSVIIVPEFSARHVSHASSFPEYVNFDQNAVRVDNPWIQNIWQQVYTTINAANNIIASVPEMEENAISDEKRQQFIGEAKFVRALNYFFMVRAFGAIPFPLTPTEEDSELLIPRTPIPEVYAQIVTDLEEASGIPDSYGDNATTKGRATGLAAKALLAKVQLYHANITGDYAQAASTAQEVIASGVFSLQGTFSTIWANENTEESIFELQFDEQVTNPLALQSNDNASNLFYAKSVSIYDMYEDDDQRRDFTVYSGTRNRYYIGKYPQGEPATQNLPVIRLAELYLIHAEAQARIDGTVSDAAYNSLKEVRDRAGIETPPASSYGSLDDFIVAVQKEKELEMMFEGESWFDFCRTELALTDMMSIADPNFFLYPIPGNQIILNQQLDQNPGY
ncbi:RagB/SusD family nutrient uptake outer membrane protein [Olivibacter sp. SDN3]|uniref:RagB/SusD family nutrient uptake outer membrane protein n=1 Tax=Olivibacter sp. SDN3 TaxID=2764720 RepID=UPI00165144C9|nr:RagB/SusD family nutrient uptake outer membrane protein [Olivibacter sp. SDN3]QNL47674.1 RagB/SusD family nutrient uptake outer membrane protein [Olivibacter sp. SDN3]